MISACFLLSYIISHSLCILSFSSSLGDHCPSSLFLLSSASSRPLHLLPLSFSNFHFSSPAPLLPHLLSSFSVFRVAASNRFSALLFFCFRTSTTHSPDPCPLCPHCPSPFSPTSPLFSLLFSLPYTMLCFLLFLFIIPYICAGPSTRETRKG